MAELHHDHHAHHDTVIEDRTGPAGVLGVLAIAALIGFLIWLFAFSGLVFDRGGNAGTGGGTDINVEQQQDAPAGGGQEAPAPQNS